jgi:uncharacterized protein
MAFLCLFLSAGSIFGQSTDSDFAGHWEGTISREGKNWRVWLDIEEDKNSLTGTTDFPDYGIYALQTSATTSGNQVKINVKEGRDTAVFDGKLSADEIDGSWNGLGLTAEFKLSRIESQPLTPYVVEEVQFQNGDAVLAGTLVRPNKPGRHPAIVFAHGSGNQTRSETFYRSRAFWFARNGIAALIYDRRGKGSSKGGGAVTWNNLADDALAAVRLLKTRAEINPKQVGVGGFSQGGWVAPLAAVRSKDAAFVLVGSAAAISPLEQNDYNVESVLRNKQVPEEKIKAVMELRGNVKRFQLTGAGDKNQLEKTIAGFKGETWFKDAQLGEKIEVFDFETRDYMTFNPAAVWEKVNVPVLALWGADDLAVPARRSREIIDLSLKNGRGKTYDLREFPGAGHGISIVSEKNAAWDFPRLVAGYQELMVTWTQKMAQRSR